MVDQHTHLAVPQCRTRTPVHASNENTRAIDDGALVVQFDDGVGVGHQPRRGIEPLGRVPIRVEHVDGIANLFVPLCVESVQHQAYANASLRCIVESSNDWVFTEAPVPVQIQILDRKLD